MAVNPGPLGGSPAATTVNIGPGGRDDRIVQLAAALLPSIPS
jgi:hypothetical protein